MLNPTISDIERARQVIKDHLLPPIIDIPARAPRTPVQAWWRILKYGFLARNDRMVTRSVPIQLAALLLWVAGYFMALQMCIQGLDVNVLWVPLGGIVLIHDLAYLGFDPRRISRIFVTINILSVLGLIGMTIGAELYWPLWDHTLTYGLGVALYNGSAFLLRARNRLLA